MHELKLIYDDDVHKRMHQLMQLTETKTESEVIRKALSYYHYLLTEVVNGGTVILQKADGTEEEIDVKWNILSNINILDYLDRWPFSQKETTHLFIELNSDDWIKRRIFIWYFTKVLG